MYFYYKIITYLFYPLAPFYLVIRKLRKKEDHKRYREKLAITSIPRGNGYLVWFHVASVGEAMSILPLIDSCIKEIKIDKILITSITLSSGRVLEKKYNQNSKVIHQFLPLDIKIFTNKFLNYWKPNLSIFVDSEIWPNLILNISEKKIPLLLINARITKKSFNRWKLVKNFAKKIFEKFDLCIASNEESENFLKNLGSKNIKNYGNLKFSRTKNNLDINLNSDFFNQIKNKKVWCAASTHPSEEIFCAKTHLKLKVKYKNVLTIIIPRHINRVKKINKELSKLNLKIALFSELNKISNDTDILVVNTYGETIKFYNIVKNVFLGKSITKKLAADSGQNPIEPARFGCKIFHGPNVSNFTEIYKYLKTLDVSKEVNNSDELFQSLTEEFDKDHAKDEKIKEKLDNFGQNILNNVIIELKKYINNYK